MLTPLHRENAVNDKNVVLDYSRLLGYDIILIAKLILTFQRSSLHQPSVYAVQETTVGLNCRMFITGLMKNGQLVQMLKVGDTQTTWLSQKHNEKILG